jgi:ethanolamine utilization protein EutN
MRIGRVIGTLTLQPKLDSLGAGRLLIVDVLDEHALRSLPEWTARAKAMAESLVIYDQGLNPGQGQLVAISEGREAAVPFGEKRVPVDAFCAAILDTIHLTA